MPSLKKTSTWYFFSSLMGAFCVLWTFPILEGVLWNVNQPWSSLVAVKIPQPASFGPKNTMKQSKLSPLLSRTFADLERPDSRHRMASARRTQPVAQRLGRQNLGRSRNLLRSSENDCRRLSYLPLCVRIRIMRLHLLFSNPNGKHNEFLQFTDLPHWRL